MKTTEKMAKEDSLNDEKVADELLVQAAGPDADNVEAAVEKTAAALERYRRLEASDGDGRLDAKIAAALQYLATLHARLEQNEDAERECVEALEIFRRLEAANPGGFEYEIALSLCILGGLHEDIANADRNRKELAVREYSEALAIYRRLAEKNPEEFEKEVARLLRKLSERHLELREEDKGWKEYAESAKLFRRLGMEEE